MMKALAGVGWLFILAGVGWLLFNLGRWVERKEQARLRFCGRRKGPAPCKGLAPCERFLRLWREEIAAAFRSLWKGRLTVILLVASLSPFALIVCVARGLASFSSPGVAVTVLVLLSVLYAILWRAGINAWQRLKDPRW
ncbi:MAG: hypothetical protein ACYCUK_00620 [Thiomonas sp.]